MVIIQHHTIPGIAFVPLCYRKMLVVTTYLCILMSIVDGHRLLMVPLSWQFNSRFINVLKMAEIAAGAEHDVTVLVNERMIDQVKSPSVHVTSFKVPHNVTIPIINPMEYGKLTLAKYSQVLKIIVTQDYNFCNYLLSDKDTFQQLKQKKFDLILVDILDNCGRILIAYLDVPSIVYSNFGFYGDGSIFYPQLPSFVCPYMGITCSSDEMTFYEKIATVLLHGLIQLKLRPDTITRFNGLRDKHNLTLAMGLRNAYAKSIILINAEFVLDYPRPVMPHIFMISGLFYEKPKALPDDLESFVQSAGDHGVIVLSFGTLVTKFGAEEAEIIARVFARLPQKVLWRYTGTTPNSLGLNTKLVGWFPQNDVLAHPLVKLFVTHCGISGTFEAAYNGIPVVAVPLFIDQHYNAAKLVKRAKMGVLVDFETLSEASFEAAIQEVLRNDAYARNARHISQMISDVPTPPKQRLLHLFDYVIKYKGAKHLVSTVPLSMNIFQFYAVDVILALVIMLLLAVVVMICGIVLCYRLCKKLCTFSKTKQS